MLLVCLDDQTHQVMPDYITLIEVAKGQSLNIAKNVLGLHEP
jgi:hypothetical protein